MNYYSTGDQNMTSGTLTTAGWIIHKKGPNGIMMPVVLDFQNQMNHLQPPLQRKDSYVYALPGGLRA